MDGGEPVELVLDGHALVVRDVGDYDWFVLAARFVFEARDHDVGVLAVEAQALSRSFVEIGILNELMSRVVPLLALVGKSHLRVIVLFRGLVIFLDHTVLIPVLREIEHAV